MQHRVLVVEDDERIAELLQEYLGNHGFRVSHEGRGDRAVQRILDESPDVVVLDLMLPGESGLSICRRVRDQFDGAIVMLTARGDDVDQVLGLELGADDYIAKPFNPRVLLARLQTLLRRGARNERADCREDGNLLADRSSREVRVVGERVEVTTAEFDLLWALLSHPGQPVTREALFQELRGIPYDGYDRSMDVRVSQLRRKLFIDRGLPSRIVTVRGTGYQLVRT